MEISSPLPHIDQILLRGTSNQSDETQQQEENHSLQRIIMLHDVEHVSGTSNSLRHNQPHYIVDKLQGHKLLEKWPKSNSKLWETFSADTGLILSGINGIS